MPRGARVSQPGSACARGGWLPSHLQQGREAGDVVDGEHLLAPHAATGYKELCHRVIILFALPLCIKFTPPNHPLMEGLSPGNRFGREEAIFHDGEETHRSHQRPQPWSPHPTPLGCEGRKGAHCPATPADRRVPLRRDTRAVSPGALPPPRGRGGCLPFPCRSTPPQRGARLPPRMQSGPCPSPRARLGNGASRRERRRKVARRQGRAMQG